MLIYYSLYRAMLGTLILHDAASVIKNENAICLIKRRVLLYMNELFVLSRIIECFARDLCVMS